MRNCFLLFVFLFCVYTTDAQEHQPGIVKTIGRPGQAGEPLGEVMIRAQGTSNATLSDSEGNFNLVLASHDIGQAYSLSRVFKMGYQLVDEGVIGRQYPYSNRIPLEIAMVSNEVYNRTKSNIESEVRARIEKEYQMQVDLLGRQLADKTISEERHIQKLCELNDYYDKTENLISKLADKYAKIDYDRLDSLDMQISFCIEQGKLEEAEALIQSKGTRQALEQLKKDNLMLEQSLEEGRKAEARMEEDYAAELMARADIASMRFDNAKAAACLKERMDLDTTRVEWGIDYAIFIQEYLGNYDEALAIFNNALLIVDSPSVRDDIYGTIGNLYHAKGDSEKALEYYLISAELRKEHDLSVQELAKSYYNIASIRLKRNEYAPALDYLEKAHVIYNELADSLGIASVYVTMADNSADHGRFEEAVSYLKKALRIRVNEYGESHQLVASVYKSLAEVLKAFGKFEEATECVLKAHDIFVKIFGERHPNVASAYYTMGALSMEVEDFDNALLYYEKALDIYEEFYSGVHPDIAALYSKISQYYGRAKTDYNKAISYGLQFKDQVMKLYGRTHSAVAVSLNSLSTYYSRMEQYDKAVECSEEAAVIVKELYGQEHIALANVYHNISTLQYKMGRCEEAIDLMEEVLRMFIAHYGENHPNVATVYNNLGQFEAGMKNYSKALEYMILSKSLYERIYGNDNSHIATACDNIAVIYKELSQYDKAEELALQALEIRRRKLGEEHQDTALSYNNLAMLYQSLARWDEAEEFYRRSLEVERRIYGENSVGVVKTYSNMASLYSEMCKYDLSLEYAHKALNISKDLFGWGHSRTILCRFGVAECYSQMKNHDEAINYFHSLYYDFLESEGPDHDYTKRFFRELHGSYANVMSMEDYDGRYDEAYSTLNATSTVVARVVEDSQASQMGLCGVYHVVSNEEWDITRNDVNYFVYNLSLASRQKRIYVLYRDDEFYVIPFEGVLGIKTSPEWISQEDKLDLIRKYKKWARKNK